MSRMAREVDVLEVEERAASRNSYTFSFFFLRRITCQSMQDFASTTFEQKIKAPGQSGLRLQR